MAEIWKLNTAEAKYANALARSREQSTNQTFEAALTGSIGKIGVEKSLRDLNWDVDAPYRNAENMRGYDLEISCLRITVRSWNKSNWEEWGRCIPQTQVAKITEFSDVIIWATVDDSNPNEPQVTIQGFNWINEIYAWPRKLTGPENAKVDNVQGPQSKVWPIERLALSRNTGTLAPMPLPQILGIQGPVSINRRKNFEELGYVILDPDEIKLGFALTHPSDALISELFQAFYGSEIQKIRPGELLAELNHQRFISGKSEKNREVEKFGRATTEFFNQGDQLLIACLRQWRRRQMNSLEMEIDWNCESCANNVDYSRETKATEAIAGFANRPYCACCRQVFSQPKLPEHIHETWAFGVRREDNLTRKEKLLFVNISEDDEGRLLQKIGAEIWQTVPTLSANPKWEGQIVRGDDLIDWELIAQTFFGLDVPKIEHCVYDDGFSKISTSTLSRLESETGLKGVDLFAGIEEFTNMLALTALFQVSDPDQNLAAALRDELSTNKPDSYKDLAGKLLSTAIDTLGDSLTFDCLFAFIRARAANRGIFITGFHDSQQVKTLMGLDPKISPRAFTQNFHEEYLGSIDVHNEETYCVGDSIEHMDYGFGTVSRVIQANPDGRIEVLFGNGRMRIFKSPHESFRLVKK